MKNNFFILTWKKVWIVAVIGFVSIILHNLVTALIGQEEIFFFLIVTILVPAYVVIGLVITILGLFKEKKPKK